MPKAIAIFLTVLYTCFTTSTLWAAPVASYFILEQSGKESNKEINDPEPFKDFEPTHFSKVVKNLPGKIKLPKVQSVLFQLRKPVQHIVSIPGTTMHGSKNFLLPDTPLFLKNSVFRI